MDQRDLWVHQDLRVYKERMDFQAKEVSQVCPAFKESLESKDHLGIYPQLLVLRDPQGQKEVLDLTVHLELMGNQVQRETLGIKALLDDQAETVKTAFEVQRVTQDNQDHQALLANPVEMECWVPQVHLEPKSKERKSQVLQDPQDKMVIQDLWVSQDRKVNVENEGMQDREEKMENQVKEVLQVFQGKRVCLV